MLDGVYQKISVDLMGKVLDLTSSRQRIIGGNIANASTPGYTGKRMNFEESLARAEQKSGLAGLRSHERHMQTGTQTHGGPVVEDTGAAPALEQEMAASAENQLLYAAAARVVSGKFSSLRGVIRGRF